MIEYLTLSVLSAFGMAVALVEKKRQWPVRRYSLLLQRKILPKIHRRLGKMLDCTVCASFWTALVTDSVLFVYSDFHYFMWPLSGFVTLGLMWAFVQLLWSFNTPEIMKDNGSLSVNDKESVKDQAQTTEGENDSHNIPNLPKRGEEG